MNYFYKIIKLLLEIYTVILTFVAITYSLRAFPKSLVISSGFTLVITPPYRINYLKI